jgi:hypothetical protein
VGEEARLAACADVAVSDEGALRFLQLCARLLLVYNVRSELIKRQIDRLARHLGVEVMSFVAYRDVTLVATGGRNFHAQAPELRINVAISLAVQRVIDALLASDIGLDEATRRNLELTEAIRGASQAQQGSLLHVLDATLTPMGGRLLRRRLNQPLLDVAAINARLDAVTAWHDDAPMRAELRQALRGVGPGTLDQPLRAGHRLAA